MFNQIISYMAKTKFGKRLAELRKQKGFTQIMLADAIGVSQRVVAYYECETDRPPAGKLSDIAKALEVSVDELLGLKEVKAGRGAPKNAYLRKKLQLVELFPKSDQKAIVTMIEGLAAKNKQ